MSFLSMRGVTEERTRLKKQFDITEVIIEKCTAEKILIFRLKTCSLVEVLLYYILKTKKYYLLTSKHK